MSNHLGNVLAVVTDKKLPVDENTNGFVSYYLPEVFSTSDYSPFGVILDGRNFNSKKFRYSFNFQEKVSEIAPEHHTAEFWEYDPRSAKRWNVDPASSKHPIWSPYHINFGNPIWFKDPKGDEPDNNKGKPAEKKADGTYTTSIDNTDVTNLNKKIENEMHGIPSKRGGIVFTDEFGRGSGAPEGEGEVRDITGLSPSTWFTNLADEIKGLFGLGDDKTLHKTSNEEEKLINDGFSSTETYPDSLEKKEINKGFVVRDKKTKDTTKIYLVDPDKKIVNESQFEFEKKLEKND